MITPQIKERAPAFRPNVRPEHTLDTDLPQELSKLPDHESYPELRAPARQGVAVPCGACQKMAAAPKGTVAASANPRKQVLPTTGLMDEGHPTILAPTRI